MLAPANANAMSLIRFDSADAYLADWLLEMHCAFADEARVASARESQTRLVDERLAAGTFRIVEPR